MRNNKNIKNMQNNKGAIINRTQNKAITLISLVITIVILIVLAGVAINLTVGQNGIFTKAKEAKRLQIVAEAKEKIGTDILSAQVDATERNEELEQTQIEDIISKYGELQSDGDTIILKDNGYEISLLDIYNGTITTTGSYSELKAKVELLEKQLEDASKSQSEASKELTELKTILSGTTVTEDKILKDYTAYKDGKLITGILANYVGQTLEASSTILDGTNMYLTIPQAGYYDTTSKITTLNNNLVQETKEKSFGIVVSPNAGGGAFFHIPCKNYSTLQLKITDWTLTGQIRNGDTNVPILNITAKGTYNIDVSNMDFVYFSLPPETGSASGRYGGVYSLIP